MKLFYKLGSGAVAIALIGSTFATAASADVTIADNGAHSTNIVTVTTACNSTVSQDNKTKAKTNIKVNQSTGGNEANSNTGEGSVLIDTGDATATLTVAVTGGANTATTPDCCECLPVVGPIDITANGANSDSTVAEIHAVNNSASQTNKTKSKVRAKVKQKTGKNKANNNTGSGAVDVLTGSTTATGTVTVTGSGNTLNP